MAQLEFMFDYVSPTSYVAWRRFGPMLERTGAEAVYVPVLLGGIFKATGNVSPITTAAKRAWLFDDLQLFADRHSVPLTLNSHFPFNTTPLLRGAIAALDRSEFGAYSDAVFDGIWRDGLNMADPEVTRSVLSAAGLDGDAYAAASEDEAIKLRLRGNTEDAVARGVFGAPTFFVGERMYFGQDRLDFVEEALSR